MLKSPEDAIDASPIHHIKEFNKRRSQQLQSNNADPTTLWPPIVLAHGGCECTPYKKGAKKAFEEFQKAGDRRVRIHVFEEEAHVSEIVRVGLSEDAITPFLTSFIWEVAH